MPQTMIGMANSQLQGVGAKLNDICLHARVT